MYRGGGRNIRNCVLQTSRMSSSSSADDVDEEEAAPGGSGKGGAATAAGQLTVRRYDHERDAESVRRLWPVALLANCAAYGYPPTLVAEEEEFVRETMTGGDMLDLREMRGSVQ